MDSAEEGQLSLQITRRLGIILKDFNIDLCFKRLAMLRLITPPDQSSSIKNPPSPLKCCRSCTVIQVTASHCSDYMLALCSCRAGNYEKVDVTTKVNDSFKTPSQTGPSRTG